MAFQSFGRTHTRTQRTRSPMRALRVQVLNVHVVFNSGRKVYTRLCCMATMYAYDLLRIYGSGCEADCLGDIILVLSVHKCAASG